jgi:hypothetical protein
MIVTIIVFLCVLLAGYSAGRRTGLAAGVRRGIESARLELLGQSLDQGMCRLCNYSFSEEMDDNCYADGFLIQWNGKAGGNDGKSNPDRPADT